MSLKPEKPQSGTNHAGRREPKSRHNRVQFFGFLLPEDLYTKDFALAYCKALNIAQAPKECKLRPNPVWMAVTALSKAVGTDRIELAPVSLKDGLWGRCIALTTHSSPLRPSIEQINKVLNEFAKAGLHLKAEDAAWYRGSSDYEILGGGGDESEDADAKYYED